MNPELIAAVKERIELGHDDEAITAELRAAGYNDAAVAAAISAARSAADGTAPTTSIPKAPETAVPLTAFTELFKTSFTYAWHQRRLVGWYCAVVLGFGLSLLLSALVVALQPVAGYLMLALVIIGGAIGMQVFALAVQRIIATDTPDGTATLRDGWQWARANFFFAGFWVMFLSALIIQGAITLFLIPFIVIGPFISFMVYAYILEGFKGMTAVLRARELGKGNWWPLLWRKSLFVSIIALPMVVMVAGAVAAMMFVLFSQGIPGDADFPDLIEHIGWIAVVSLCLIVYAVFAGIWSLRFNALLFRQLAAARPATEESGKGQGTWKYVVLAVIGALSMLYPGDDGGSAVSHGDGWQEDEQVEMAPLESLKDKARELRGDGPQ